MEAVMRRDALGETYNDVKGLIEKVIGRFQKEFGGNFEDLRSEANLIFILAYDSYNETKGQFTTWTYFSIWKGLLDYRRQLKKRGFTISINSYNPAELIIAKTPTNPLSLIDLLDELKGDSNIIAHLVWESSTEIGKINPQNGNSPCHMRKALKKYLFQLGWTGRRIKESFEEVRRALNA